jgi:SHAQKYF class myb-like DNA-binding protein
MGDNGGDSDRVNIDLNVENQAEKTTSSRPNQPSRVPVALGRQCDAGRGNIREALFFVDADLQRINSELHDVDLAIGRLRQSQARGSGGNNREEEATRGADQFMVLGMPAATSSGGGLMGAHPPSIRPGTSASLSRWVSDDMALRGRGSTSSRSIRSSHSDGGPRKRGRPSGSKGVYSRPAKPRPWTVNEHDLFLQGIERYGRGRWAEISTNMLSHRTAAQIASHAQKYFGKGGWSDSGGGKTKGFDEEGDDHVEGDQKGILRVD